MKKSEKKELLAKSKEELNKLLLEYKSEILKISIEQKARRMRNTALLGKKRQNIARIKTILKDKELQTV